MLYNEVMNVAKFVTGGRRIRPDNFISVVSVMLAVAASASDIVVRASTLAGLLVYDMNGYDGLYIAAGAVTALGALYLAASVLVARTGRMGTLPMIFPACVIAVGLLFVAALALNWDTFGNFFVENIWRPLNSRMSLSLWWIIAALAVLAAACLLLVFRFRNRSSFCGKAAGALHNMWSGLREFDTFQGVN